MTYVHLTWYLLVDGTHADPNDVSPGKDGVLRHKGGLAVALHGDGTPQSIGRGAVENKNVEAAQVGVSDAPPPEKADPAPAKLVPDEPKKTLSLKTPAKEMDPEKAKPAYKTREVKAR